jgi:thioredoxin 1
VLENIAAEYAGKVIIAKVNTDENSQWAMKYGVQGIPTLLFVTQGQIQDRLVGAAPAPTIKTKVDALLKAASGV